MSSDLVDAPIGFKEEEVMTTDETLDNAEETKSIENNATRTVLSKQEADSNEDSPLSTGINDNQEKTNDQAMDDPVNATSKETDEIPPGDANFAATDSLNDTNAPDPAAKTPDPVTAAAEKAAADVFAAAEAAAKPQRMSLRRPKLPRNRVVWACSVTNKPTLLLPP